MLDLFADKKVEEIRHDDKQNDRHCRQKCAGCLVNEVLENAGQQQNIKKYDRSD
jgi:hypothetical protein